MLPKLSSSSQLVNSQWQLLRTKNVLLSSFCAFSDCKLSSEELVQLRRSPVMLKVSAYFALWLWWLCQLNLVTDMTINYIKKLPVHRLYCSYNTHGTHYLWWKFSKGSWSWCIFCSGVFHTELEQALHVFWLSPVSMVIWPTTWHCYFSHCSPAQKNEIWMAYGYVRLFGKLERNRCYC